MARLVQFRGKDCWRTWFFDECEGSGLFGINEKHLGLIRLRGVNVHPYHVGTQVYLDDEPVFRASGRKLHRVCGPYEVVSAEPLPEGGMIEHEVQGIPILYREARPELGPWGNGTRVRRAVAGFDLKYRQKAGDYNYYPFRFRIRRSPRWAELLVPHAPDCELRDY